MKKTSLIICACCMAIAGLTSCDDAKAPVIDNAIYLSDAIERDSYDCVNKVMKRMDFDATVKMTSRVDHPVTVTVSVNEEVIKEHNKQFGEALSILPAENYYLTDQEGNRVDGNSVQLTIPAMSTTALLPISILPVAEDDANQYALPLKITSASDDIKVLGKQNMVLYMFQKPFETNAIIINPRSLSTISLTNQEWVPESTEWTVEFHFTMDLTATDTTDGIVMGQPVFYASTRGGGEMIYIRIYKPESYFDIHAQGTFWVADFHGGNFGDRNNQGIWHHVAITCKGGMITSYFDGEQQNVNSSAKWVTPIAWGECHMGSDSHMGYIGMSELRIWSVARSKDDLKRNKYNVSPDAKGLLVSFRLNDVNNNLLKDNSSHQYHLDISDKSNNRRNQVRWCRIKTDDEFKSFVTVSM